MLKEKRKRFVEEYLKDLNGAQAAIRAGYSKNRADQTAYTILSNSEVAQYLQERRQQLADNTDITPEKILKELAKIGFADIRKAVKWSHNLGQIVTDEEIVQTNGVQLVSSDDIDDSTAAAISEVSNTRDGGIKIKFHDKQAALVSMGRRFGMFNDKLALGGQSGNPVIFQLSELDEKI